MSCKASFGRFGDIIGLLKGPNVASPLGRRLTNRLSTKVNGCGDTFRSP